jgi:hypothetical protein
VHQAAGDHEQVPDAVPWRRRLSKAKKMMPTV